ncbi:hypothetical protein ACFL6C_11815 [Myxococcota bacterium]
MDEDSFRRTLDRMRPWAQTRLRSLLTALASAAESPKGYIEEILQKFDEAHTLVICEYEYDVIERVLGAGFVAVQAQITRVASGALAIRRLASAINVELDELPKNRREYVDASCPSHPACKCIQVIDDAANYFKHHTQWGADWAQVTNLNEPTIDRVSGYGAEPTASDNIQRMLRHLGYRNLWQLVLLAHDVDDWAIGWVNTCEDAVHKIWCQDECRCKTARRSATPPWIADDTDDQSGSHEST